MSLALDSEQFVYTGEKDEIDLHALIRSAVEALSHLDSVQPTLDYLVGMARTNMLRFDDYSEEETQDEVIFTVNFDRINQRTRLWAKFSLKFSVPEGQEAYLAEIGISALNSALLDIR